MLKKGGYKGNRKPWTQIEREFAECRRKKFYESQVRKNEIRISEGLDPLPIEDYPTFAPITPQLLSELARQSEELRLEHERLNNESPSNTNEEDTDNHE